MKETTIRELEELFALQKSAFASDSYPSLEVRIERLKASSR